MQSTSRHMLSKFTSPVPRVQSLPAGVTVSEFLTYEATGNGNGYGDALRYGDGKRHDGGRRARVETDM